MGISTSNRIGNETSYNGNSSNTAKTKTDENIRDTFQNIMGLVNANKNQSSDYGVKSDKSSLNSKTASNSTNAYKKESLQLDADTNKVKNSSDSSKAAAERTDSLRDSVSTVSDRNVQKMTDEKRTVSSSTTRDSNTNVESDAEVTGDCSELAAQIMQSVAEIMDVSVEQVQQSMDELGLDVNDLLGDDGVKQLVLNIQGADNIDMLVDESLGQYMDKISESVSNIVADAQNSELTEMPVEQQLKAPVSQKIEEKETDKAENNIGERVRQNDKNYDNGKSVEVDTDSNVDETDTDSSRLTTTSEVTTDTEGQSEMSQGDTSSQGQNQQENSLDNSLIDNLTQALTDAVSQSGGISDFDEDVETADIVRQVVDEIKTNISDKVRSLEISLNPESLGRVQISVTTKNGVMQARIIAENEAAKNAIEGSLNLLKETFNEQNLKVEAVEVTIASYDFFKEDNETQNNNENKQKNTSSGGNDDTGNDDIVREELSDAEQLEKDMMQQSGNSVSYTV